MDVFARYGLSVPETYDDVIASCAALKDDKDLEMPFTINLHAGWAWRVEFHNMLKAYGGDWVNADSTPAFNGPAGVKTVEKILEVVEACMGTGSVWLRHRLRAGDTLRRHHPDLLLRPRPPSGRVHAVTWMISFRPWRVTTFS